MVTPIYHITHVTNLPGIVSENGIWCDSGRAERALHALNIAHQHIKDRRAKRVVSVGAGGTLADYVPFYFAPRSPMLFTISRGNIEGYADGQRRIVHLVSSVETACKLACPFCFTDGHADMALSEFSDDLAQLQKMIDWTVMQSQYWNDTSDQPDRKRRRQAEFLVHRFFPWSAVERIGTHNREVGNEVEYILSQTQHRPKLTLEPGWYY